MSYDIRDKISIKILFNDEEFVFSRANSLIFLHMVSSTKLAMPMLHMALQDNLDSLSESKNLVDASRIQIVLKGRDDRTTTYVFRLNSSNRTPNAGGYRCEIDGYLDAVTYWHASTQTSIKGTSYKAISQIASTCGLGFSGDQTSDSQVWIPRNIKYNEWARQISERGFRSDSSCMQLGLNLDKTLVYRDLATERARTAIFLFGEYKAGTVIATDVQPEVLSGSMNHHSGYASMLVEQDLDSQDIFKPTSSVQLRREEGDRSLQVNGRVARAVEQSNVAFAPIDVGNSHPDYEKALYQNRRINNLFSSKLLLVTPATTNIRLLDRVSVSLDKTNEYLKAYSGYYHVGSRTIFVQGNEYFEKFELLRKFSSVTLQDAL